MESYSIPLEVYRILMESYRTPMESYKIPKGSCRILMQSYKILMEFCRTFHAILKDPSGFLYGLYVTPQDPYGICRIVNENQWGIRTEVYSIPLESYRTLMDS
eukprot:1024331-Pyramimonas_sp.AAC.1